MRIYLCSNCNTQQASLTRPRTCIRGCAGVYLDCIADDHSPAPVPRTAANLLFIMAAITQITIQQGKPAPQPVRVIRPVTIAQPVTGQPVKREYRLVIIHTETRQAVKVAIEGAQ